VRAEAGLAYFPAISLSYRDRSILNFGSKPFFFPVPGYIFFPSTKLLLISAFLRFRYNAIQPPPSSTKLERANYLLECLERLVHHTISSPLSSTTSSHAPSLYQFALPPEDVTILAARIFENLADLLSDDFIIASSFVPFLMRLMDEDTMHGGGEMACVNSNAEKAITKLFSLMAVCLEVLLVFPLYQLCPDVESISLQPFEFVQCIDATVHHLAIKARIEIPGGFHHLPKDPNQAMSHKGSGMPFFASHLVIKINILSHSGPYAQRFKSEYVQTIGLLVNMLKSTQVMSVFIYHEQYPPLPSPNPFTSLLL